jgi:hypothetical protein
VERIRNARLFVFLSKYRHELSDKFFLRELVPQPDWTVAPVLWIFTLHQEVSIQCACATLLTLALLPLAEPPLSLCLLFCDV